MPSGIKSIPDSERPREKLIQLGPQSLSNKELLAIILGSGNRDQEVLTLSQNILKKLGTKNLPMVIYNQLKEIKGLGQAKSCAILASIELGRRIFGQKVNPNIIIENFEDVAELVADLKLRKKEYLVALFLNSRNELIAREDIVVGGTNTAFLAPSDLFRPALEKNSSQVIIAHNHPSGNCNPSDDDLKLTERLIESGKIIGVSLLDHVIVSQKDIISLRAIKPGFFN